MYARHNNLLKTQHLRASKATVAQVAEHVPKAADETMRVPTNRKLASSSSLLHLRLVLQHLLEFGKYNSQDEGGCRLVKGRSSGQRYRDKSTLYAVSAVYKQH
jgi:hypothetical protein